MLNKIVNQLRIERHAQKVTLDELAAKSGISAKHICNIENFKSKPTIETLQKLANALGVKINIQIIGGSDLLEEESPKKAI
ncbi:transcriptional regulator with XRE-family HTH domain [Desulfohalotomaculum tongense]|uniref:helix-turn-helix domain-containing protein n=1 Tax=Desulforadius tongensis TaxID=1216062 RepID=UPI0019566500|nr:transcriptional regulator with XRE-family HTH domain [Desulforadius tongensis]